MRLHQTTETTDVDPILVERLRSQKATDQQAASERLEQMGPEAVETLLNLLQQEAQRRQRRQRMILPAIIGATLLGFSIWGLMWYLTGKLPQIGGTFSLLSIISVYLSMATAMQKNAAKQLAQFDDVRAVGPLAEALQFGDKELYRLASAKLQALLPRLMASDASLLNETQRQSLYAALRGKDLPLAQAILTALQQVGDGKALLPVRWLAEGYGLAAKSPAVRQLAQECLPFLEERARQEAMEQELLRASSAPTSTPETLLRPATAQASTSNPEHLLRASETSSADAE